MLFLVIIYTHRVKEQEKKTAHSTHHQPSQETKKNEKPF
jgi:hypothetical protein